jgi:quercetin dioxygenase-like cupin family protein
MELAEHKSQTEKVWALQREMLKIPQLELQTNHYFADGMYAREVIRPAGCLIVGKVHKKEHFYIVTKGRIAVTTDEGVREISAPAVIVSKPGTKRAVLALEDSVCMTVHRTDNTDIDVIEAELVEADDIALFDAHNRLKELT